MVPNTNLTLNENLKNKISNGEILTAEVPLNKNNNFCPFEVHSNASTNCSGESGNVNLMTNLNNHGSQASFKVEIRKLNDPYISTVDPFNPSLNMCDSLPPAAPIINNISASSGLSDSNTKQLLNPWDNHELTSNYYSCETYCLIREMHRISHFY